MRVVSSPLLLGLTTELAAATALLGGDRLRLVGGWRPPGLIGEADDDTRDGGDRLTSPPPSLQGTGGDDEGGVPDVRVGDGDDTVVVVVSSPSGGLVVVLVPMV